MANAAGDGSIVVPGDRVRDASLEKKAGVVQVWQAKDALMVSNANLKTI